MGGYFEKGQLQSNIQDILVTEWQAISTIWAVLLFRKVGSMGLVIRG
jgi:hypothetical protein